MKFLLPLVPVTIWAGNAIVNKLSVEVLSPGAMSFYRWFFAMALLTPFCLPSVIRHWSSIRPHTGKLAVLAFLGMVMNQSLGYYAAQTTSATNLSLITALVPLISLFLSVPLLGIPLSFAAIAGAVLSLSGLGYMLGEGSVATLFTHGINIGDGLVLLAAFCYAMYCVLLKRWPMAISTWHALYMQGLFAVAMLVPVFLASERVALTVESLPLVAYAALVASIVAPLCWMRAIVAIGASRSAMFMNLMPAITAVIAVFYLGEQLADYHYIGGLMVLGGVALAQRPVRRNIQTVLVQREQV